MINARVSISKKILNIYAQVKSFSYLAIERSRKKIILSLLERENNNETKI